MLTKLFVCIFEHTEQFSTCGDFSPGNSCGMLGVYNQKVNNKENKLLAETIIWMSTIMA